MTLPFEVHENAASALGIHASKLDDAVQKFAARLVIPDHEPETCWPWPGYRVKGYGSFQWRGFKWRTNRFALAVTTGKCPDVFALHHCDNPPCCRPSHLYWGTHQDNIRDAVERDRVAFGERVTVSKLTAAQVEDIRRTYQYGVRGCGLRQLARKHSVTMKTVQQIVKGKHWQRALTAHKEATSDVTRES